ncbi:MAG: hypothetical protein ACYCPA_01185 [Acidithiobacillus sp.]
MPLTSGEKQLRYRASSRENGGERLQMMISPESREILNRIQEELGWTKKKIVEVAIAQMSGRLFGKDD